MTALLLAASLTVTPVPSPTPVPYVTQAMHRQTVQRVRAIGCVHIASGVALGASAFMVPGSSEPFVPALVIGAAAAVFGLYLASCPADDPKAKP